MMAGISRIPESEERPHLGRGTRGMKALKTIGRQNRSGQARRTELPLKALRAAQGTECRLQIGIVQE